MICQSATSRCSQSRSAGSSVVWLADDVVERGHGASLGPGPCHHGSVVEGYWQAVLAGGADVPADRPLDDLTAELVGMLGDADPLRRDQAAAVLDRWIRHGVYDDLLLGIGDGVCAGLRERLGEDGTVSVLRRSFSARVLAAVIARDNERQLVGDDTVLHWGDRASGWLLREQDLRGFVPGLGWAHAVAHGADLLGMLARSRHFHAAELPVLLDVVAERLLLPTAYVLRHGEDDRLAYAVMAVLHRDLVDEPTLEAWLVRLGAGLRRPADAGTVPVEWPTEGPTEWPTPVAVNTGAFVRALHVQLAIGVRGRDDISGDAALFAQPPKARADVLLGLFDQLRLAGPELFAPAGGRALRRPAR